MYQSWLNGGDTVISCASKLVWYWLYKCSKSTICFWYFCQNTYRVHLLHLQRCQVAPFILSCTSAKWITVTGSLWKNLEVVRPESQDCEFQKVTELMLRHSNAPRSAGNKSQSWLRQCSGRSGAPEIIGNKSERIWKEQQESQESLEMQMTSLGEPWDACDKLGSQSAASAPGHCCNYWLLNNVNTHVLSVNLHQYIYVTMYVCI